MTVTLFEVGGCVRDDLLGVPTNDVDFVAIADSFDDVLAHARSLGLAPILGTFKPEFGTFKAVVPKGHPLKARCKTVDIVLARKDGFSSDGRRPDFVEPGTLLDDLRRRDFTVNAMARDSDGTIIDPFGGQRDLENRTLRFVGNPMERIREDGLRVLRALRFAVTKGFVFHRTTAKALDSNLAIKMLDKVARERVREEMEKMFRHDTHASWELISSFTGMRRAIFKDGLRLSATMKK